MKGKIQVHISSYIEKEITFQVILLIEILLLSGQDKGLFPSPSSASSTTTNNMRTDCHGVYGFKVLVKVRRDQTCNQEGQAHEFVFIHAPKI